jgi:hypothetical protein
MLTSFANSPISRRNLLRGGAFTGLATALSPHCEAFNKHECQKHPTQD